MLMIQSSMRLQYPVSQEAEQDHQLLLHQHPEAKEETLAVDQRNEREKEKVDERVHLQDHPPRTIPLHDNRQQKTLRSDKSIHPPM